MSTPGTPQRAPSGYVQEVRRRIEKHAERARNIQLPLLRGSTPELLKRHGQWNKLVHLLLERNQLHFLLSDRFDATDTEDIKKAH